MANNLFSFNQAEREELFWLAYERLTGAQNLTRTHHKDALETAFAKLEAARMADERKKIGR